MLPKYMWLQLILVTGSTFMLLVKLMKMHRWATDFPHTCTGTQKALGLCQECACFTFVWQSLWRFWATNLATLNDAALDAWAKRETLSARRLHSCWEESSGKG
jgi:hypothetical protein